jgi:hypothetical protein
MGRLKPIGSEKLEGMEKIARIMEIARYKENIPTPVNEHSSNEYSIKLADGYLYEIAKEKNGYVIKKGLNESSLDYIEPMKNRRHFSSYSGAFKRLNVIAKEVNSLTETEEGISLFTESKKYILKTPKSMEEQAEPSPTPAPAPAPEEQPMPEPAPAPAPEEQPMPEPEMPSDEEPTQEDDEEISMKTIQKLTGKLAQKIRAYDSKEEEDMSPQDVKYVINSILSALDLDKLEDEDKEEIIDKVEGDGEESSEEMMVSEPEAPSNEDMYTPEEGGEEEMTSEPKPTSGEMGENKYEYIDDVEMDYDFDLEKPKHPYKRKFHGNHKDEHDMFMMDTFESIFNESKVDKIIKGYFSLNESEKKQKTIKETAKTRSIASKIQTIAESKRQEESARNFVKHNPTATLIGKSSKNNLLFECQGKTIKVTTNGQIL